MATNAHSPHHGESPPVFSFSEILLGIIHPEARDATRGFRIVEPLAYLDYSRELEAKNRALSEFWKKNRLPEKPRQIVPSPLPRHYRTTTKRRVFFVHGKFRLRFSHHKEPTAGGDMLCSDLEPREHEGIYAFLLEKINTPAFAATAKNLTYIIVRGSYSEFCVIFNVARVNGPIVRNIKALADHLKRLNNNIVSVFVFHDPLRSEYYLDTRATDGAWKVKTIFGPDTLRLRVHDQTFYYDPVSFSQINQSMLPVMLDKAKHLCAPAPGARLIDLYCGYGIFANYVGRHFGEVFAIDADRASVERGRDTAHHSARKNTVSTRMVFRTAPITESSLHGLLPAPGDREEVVLLDPPRQGPAWGVIGYCAQRQPKRVVHIFCNTDRIPADLREWQRGGYRVSEVAALDMFPGTPNLETIVMMEPYR